MLKRLQDKWKVSAGRLVLIIATFAIGGSLCGYTGRKILGLIGLEKGLLWILIYVVVITILWPFAVLLISIPLGQFPFFKRYLSRIFRRLSGKKLSQNTVRIAIFASGAGTNAKKIMETLGGFFPDKAPNAAISLIITDNPVAGVLNIARGFQVPAEIIALKGKTDEEKDAAYLALLKKYQIDFIVLAGYLKKITPGVVKAYRQKILNIHPAMLPKYGGAGMYGNRVHEAVINAGETQSGISIHFVDEIYDNGKIVFRAACEVAKDETPDSLAQKIHVLEHQHYPEVIAKTIHSQNPR